MDVASMKRGALEKVSWNAIVTGFFCSIAVQIALGLFGGALGLLGRTSGAGWAVVGALWGLAVTAAAGFTGAYIAARIAAADTLPNAALHGVLVWSLGLVAGALFMGISMASFVPSAVGLGARAGAGTLAMAGLSALFGLAGALSGAAAGSGAVARSLGARAERYPRGPGVRAESPTADEEARAIPPRHGEEYYPPQPPPGERH